MNDLISRQAAIDALGEEPEVWTGKDEYAQGLNNQWHYDRNAILKCPSAQPDLDEWCTDCKEYDQERHSCPRWTRVIRQTLKDAQPDIIRCKDCRKWHTNCLAVCGKHGCDVVSDYTKPDDYCSWAERREE